ncbi:MAG: M3 family metallopeptidase [Pseudomonadota bacterium]
MTAKEDINPAVLNWDGPHGLPNYSKIADGDFATALLQGFTENLAEIAAIASNAETPTFENTIDALERAGETLGRAASLFFTKAGNHTNDDIQALEREFAPQFARHSGEIAKNRALFERVDALWEKREELDLNAEQRQVLKKTRRGFIRMGAALIGDDQTRLIAINERLASLGTQFGQNVLKDEKDWIMPLDESDLDGIPADLKSIMAGVAADRGYEGQYAVTTSRSVVVPFLASSKRRDLRERAFAAWTLRGENGGETDNGAVIEETLRLRAEKAKLLGFSNFAELKLDGTMAKTPGAVMELLETVWEKSRARALQEAEDVRAVMRADGVNETLYASDWRHYAERIRKERFDYSDEDTKPYLKLENIIEAAFWVANKLFGLSFKPVDGVDWLHREARTWEVVNPDDSHQALFVADYFARPSKRSGAWMSAIQTQSKLKGETPIITNTMNFAKPADGKPALISFEDARTLFHEFGHALHGMLSDVTYPSVSGTAVSRDFVELPSQLYEHWLTVPDVLEKFAVHFESGEPMPKELLDKVLAAQTFNAGFDTVEYTSSALVDMIYHQEEKTPADPLGFEAKTLGQLAMPDAMVMRHRSPHFLHIFSGDGYAAGYYSYMWSEVLDADAFSAFKESGDPFNSDLAHKLRANILSTGGTMEPEDAYLGFRGKLPTPDAMLKGRGLI